MSGRTLGRTRQVPVVVLLALLVACGGEGGEGGASSPTRTPTADQSVDRPTDRPTADRPSDRPTTDRTDDRPDPDEPGEPAPEEPTPDEPTPDEPTPDRPAPTRDRTERPEDTSSDKVLATPEPAPSSETGEPASTATADAADDEGETPSWVWWLLGALLLGTAVAVPLIVRSRRHAAWRRELAEAEGEIAWFARELLQELRHARSWEEVSGGWRVGQARVVTVEDRLAVLESSAPNQAGRDRARELLDSSRQARAGMQTLTAPGPHESWMLDLDAITDDLEHALAGRGRNPSSEQPE